MLIADASQKIADGHELSDLFISSTLATILLMNQRTSCGLYLMEKPSNESMGERRRIEDSGTEEVDRDE